MYGLEGKLQKGDHYSALQAGKWEDLGQYVITEPVKARGKLFLKEALEMTGMEVSLNRFPAGAAMPFYHKHKENEELYIFVKGSGQFEIDGEVIEIREGTVIRCAPEGVRIWRNNSSEDLYFIVIQAKANSLTSGTITDGVIVDKPV